MLRLLALPIIAYAALVAIVWFSQRRLIYFPTTHPLPRAASILPRAEDITITTEDGLRLAGWYVPAAAPASAGAVILFHGNGGDCALRAPLALALSRGGLSVLCFEYRGYGGNPGRPSEHGLAIDARAAWDWLATHPGVDPARIVFFGESLGCAVAVSLAVDRPPAALVLRSPFTSLADVGGFHYPFLPVRLLLSDRYPSIDRIPGVASPLLVIAGERDTIVPPAMSRALHDAARGPKRYLMIPGADHNDDTMLAGEQLLEETFRFLAGILAGPVGGEAAHDKERGEHDGGRAAPDPG